VFNVGTPELLVILVVALVVLGPTKLPDAARQAGKLMGELRRLSSGFQAELRDAMNDPAPSYRDPEHAAAATPAALAGDEVSDAPPVAPSRPRRARQLRAR
jgi:Tat protein translocase TatB subunit